MLSVKHLSCEKRDRLLFEQLSFDINPGELCHVQGLNGAGKTSLLRILCGLSQPSQGEVLWQGETIASVRETFHQELIYLGHKPGVNVSMTPCENLHFWCQQHGMKQSHDWYRILHNIGLVGLEDMPAAHLSAGQLRRVALCRLWLKPAKIWILDEPFTALDVKGIKLLTNTMQQHLDSGGCIILTSHQNLDMASVKVLELEYRF